MPIIWVKLFEVNGNKYCYDVGTNHIMKISPSLHDVLLKYDYTNKEEVLKDPLLATYGKEEISTTIRRIEEFNKDEGGFIPERRIRLKFPFSQEDYEFLLDNFMSHLILNSTENCNMRCRYCGFGGTYDYRRTHRKVSMSWTVMKKALDFFFSRCGLRENVLKKPLLLGLYGGEVLTEYRRMFKAVEYIKEHYPDIFPGISFSITSNGTLLTRDIIEKLIRYNFVLPISLDGPRYIHDRNRVFKNGSGTYDTIMKNLELIKTMNPDYYKKNVFFLAVVTPPYNHRDVIDFFRVTAKDLESSCSFNMADPFDTTYFDHFNMVEEEKKHRQQANELNQEFIDKKSKGEEDTILMAFLKDRYEDLHHRKIFKLPETTYPNGLCLPGVQKLFVNTDGTFHLCERMNLHFSIGDLDNGFNVGKIFDLIDRYIESTDHCKSCWAVRFCNSCFLSAIRNDVFSRERKQEYCDSFREGLLSRFIVYISILEKNPGAFNKPYPKEENIVEELVKFLNTRKTGAQSA